MKSLVLEQNILNFPILFFQWRFSSAIPQFHLDFFQIFHNLHRIYFPFLILDIDFKKCLFSYISRYLSKAIFCTRGKFESVLLNINNVNILFTSLFPLVPLTRIRSSRLRVLQFRPQLLDVKCRGS